MPKDPHTHDWTDEFDRHITQRGKHMPAYLLDACVYVRDTLDTARLAAKVALGTEDPQVVLGVLDRIMVREAVLRAIDDREADIHNAAILADK